MDARFVTQLLSPAHILVHSSQSQCTDSAQVSRDASKHAAEERLVLHVKVGSQHRSNAPEHIMAVATQRSDHFICDLQGSINCLSSRKTRETRLITFGMTSISSHC